jgi:elongation factor Ts
MAVDVTQLKALREETGLSLADCKQALEEGSGNVDKAKELLAQWGKKSAAKRQDREAGEGRIEVYLHGTGKVGVMVDLRSETDFVAKGEDFQNLAHEIALQIASMRADTVEELLEQEYIKDSSKKMKDLVTEAAAKLGENIKINKFVRFEV